MQKLINSGIYVLELKLNSRIRISHKKFTHFIFSPGYYYYVGSAQSNLQKRIQRHLRGEKKLHWHIDYLTSIPEITCEKIYILENEEKKLECELAKSISNKFSTSFPAIGFGNSDCSNCKSHLLYIETKIDQSQLLSLYHFTVLSIPSSREICWE